jgi:pyridoxine kinase
MATPAGSPCVLSVQSHVVHGYVGNRAATFPLQLLGIEVDALNSVQFSNHTGYPHFKGQRLQGSELVELLQGLELNNLLRSYTHLLTGYIGSASFLESVLDVHARLKAANPKLVYVCDPVMGDLLDDGREKLYVPQELVRIYRERVLPLADIVKPNQYECELLTERKLRSDQDALAAAEALHARGPRVVVITSLYYSELAQTGGSDLHVLGSERLADGTLRRAMLSVPRQAGYWSGLGDLIAALILAWHARLGDGHIDQVLRNAVATVQAVIRNTRTAGTREIRLVQSKRDIEYPPTDIPMTVKVL